MHKETFSPQMRARSELAKKNTDPPFILPRRHDRVRVTDCSRRNKRRKTLLTEKKPRVFVCCGFPPVYGYRTARQRHVGRGGSVPFIPPSGSIRIE
ncbi:hypothetical protein CEXT_747781 [Caerostris extrusa]|uniref:Uncharacterized protein n=1 Tax=Caerostris extrusa TaxID=172846 RepID=A0AAV4T3J1_CAEEX|nr:hypothetical protein CEXT_747781 [Caerostris extrusa]